MAIVFRTPAASATLVGTTSTTIPLPTGTAEDDVLLLVATQRTAYTWTGPGGDWILLVGDPTSRLTIWGLRAGATPTAPSISISTDANQNRAVVYAASGCRTSSTPWGEIGTKYVASFQTLSTSALATTGSDNTIVSILWAYTYSIGKGSSNNDYHTYLSGPCSTLVGSANYGFQQTVAGSTFALFVGAQDANPTGAGSYPLGGFYSGVTATETVVLALVPAASSGSTYTETISAAQNTVTATESLSVSGGRQLAEAAESATLVDSLDHALRSDLVFSEDVTAAIWEPIADEYLPGAPAGEVTNNIYEEAVSASDSAEAKVLASSSVAESNSAEDAISGASELSAELDTSTSVSDQLKAATYVAADVSDAVSASDEALAYALASSSASYTALANDLASAATKLTAVPTETVAAVELGMARVAGQADIAEAIPATDSSDAKKVGASDASESIVSTDALNAYTRSATTAFESATASDLLGSADIGTSVYAAAVTSVDSFATAEANDSEFAEQAVSTDTLNSAEVNNSEVGESVSSTDLIDQRLLAPGASLSDGLASDYAITTDAKSGVSLSESATLSPAYLGYPPASVGAGGASSYVSVNFKRAVQLTSTSSFTATKVYWKTGSWQGAGTFTWKIHLYADAGGMPGAILSEHEILNKVLADGGGSTTYIHEWELATPVSIQAGTPYWLGFHVGPNAALLYPSWTSEGSRPGYTDTTDVYTNGTLDPWSGGTSALTSYKYGFGFTSQDSVAIAYASLSQNFVSESVSAQYETATEKVSGSNVAETIDLTDSLEAREINSSAFAESISAFDVAKSANLTLGLAAETVAAADSSDAQEVNSSIATESVTSTEALVASLRSTAASVELTTTSDLLGSSNVGQELFAESITVDDEVRGTVVGGAQEFDNPYTESSAATDQADTRLLLGVRATESVTSVESFSTSGALKAVNAETLSAAAVVDGHSNLSGLLTDAVSATDSVNGKEANPSSVIESIVAGDQAAATSVLKAYGAETVASVDSIAAKEANESAVTEAVAPTDALAIKSLLAVELSETTSLSEASQGSGQKVHDVPLAEPLSASEQFNTTLRTANVIAEGAAAQDLAATSQAIKTIAAESVAASDVLRAVISVSFTESASATDSAAASSASKASQLESVTATDAAGTRLVGAASVSEVVASSVSDAPSVIAAADFAETATVSEQLELLPTTPGFVQESAALDDALESRVLAISAYYEAVDTSAATEAMPAGSAIVVESVVADVTDSVLAVSGSSQVDEVAADVSAESAFENLLLVVESVSASDTSDVGILSSEAVAFDSQVSDALDTRNAQSSDLLETALLQDTPDPGLKSLDSFTEQTALQISTEATSALVGDLAEQIVPTDRLRFGCFATLAVRAIGFDGDVAATNFSIIPTANLFARDKEAAGQEIPVELAESIAAADQVGLGFGDEGSVEESITTSDAVGATLTIPCAVSEDVSAGTFADSEIFGRPRLVEAVNSGESSFTTVLHDSGYAESTDVVDDLRTPLFAHVPFREAVIAAVSFSFRLAHPRLAPPKFGTATGRPVILPPTGAATDLTVFPVPVPGPEGFARMSTMPTTPSGSATDLAPVPVKKPAPVGGAQVERAPPSSPSGSATKT